MWTRNLGKVNHNDLWTVHIRVKEVLDILKSMKVDKFIGPDQVYPRHCGKQESKLQES